MAKRGSSIGMGQGRGTVLGLALGLLAAVPCAAADPAAIVEDVQGSVAGLLAMDYLPAGKIIRLGPKTTLTLGYLRSCTEEVITGGMVTIGIEESRIDQGSVVRRKVECDGGRMRLTLQQSAQSGVVPFRGGLAALPPPDLVLYGTRPVLRLSHAGLVRIERLDIPEAVISVAAPDGAAQDAKAPSYDFAHHQKSLAAGGLYRASGPGGEIVFRIDPGARAADVPVIGRLVRL